MSLIGTRRAWLRALLYGGPPLVAGYAFGIEPRRLRERRLRLSDRPTVRFAYFTDLHFKGDPRLLNRVVSRLRAMRPEFALFGGDLVEKADHLDAALEALGRAGLPIFGVPGNHDYWSGSDFDRIGEALRRTGGDWLLDASARVPVGAGRGHVRVNGHTCQTDVVLPPEPNQKNFALIHYPKWVERLPVGYDLILAGHSHGGQVRLPFFGALAKPSGVGRYEWGRYDTPAGPLYVSSGIGTFHLNVRFLCPPELVWIDA
ncbi:MAG: metallophosphoesterase [Verrucomicrobiae bacterium]|nr:metallophosphoesterase [Verrucomicrobiae bacterium]